MIVIYILKKQIDIMTYDMYWNKCTNSVNNPVFEFPIQKAKCTS